MDRMSWDTFVENIRAIKEFSDKIDDGWELFENSEEKYIYLCKKIRKLYNNDELVQNETGKCVKNVYFFEFHVVYSISYGVPVLCFNIWNSDGRLLTMEESWKFFNPYYCNENMHAVITQNDHPVLMTPILMFHPCRTVELMETFLKTSKNPIISWLSAICPAINLPITNEYEILTRIEASSIQ